jgi:serine kinase of HPr protein (carbohydrate metabolism regulator)
VSGAEPILHATVVAAWMGGAWRGAMLRGPSGAGKSALALCGLAAGARLAADDRARVWASGGRLFARAPETLHGLIEARGLGVLPVAAPLPWAQVGLVVDLAADPAAIERTPEPEWETIAGVRVRRIALFGAESAAWAKLRLALQAATLGAGLEPAYQGRLADEAKARRVKGASQEE